MDKRFWEKLSKIWIHTQSDEERQNTDEASNRVLEILGEDTETKYRKNPLLEDD